MENFTALHESIICRRYKTEDLRTRTDTGVCQSVSRTTPLQQPGV